MEPSTMHWLQWVSQGAANAVVSSLWEGLVLAASIGLCLRLVPKTSASSRFIIWTAVFLVLALLPFLHLPHLAHSGIATSNSGPLLQLDVRWSIAITFLWLLSSLVRATRLALHGYKLRVLWRNSSPVTTGVLCHSLLCHAGHRTAQLCTTTDLDRPSVIGFFSPRILIPAWLFETLSQAELEQIILHEVEHLRRGDDWINLLQKFNLALFPLNPVLMWIEKRLCLERELACDDGVVHATRAPRAYATCLTSLAERHLYRGLDPRANSRATAALTLGAWERRSALSRRVHSILRRGEVLSPRQACAVTSAVVIGLLVGATELSRSPRLVSFSAPTHPEATLAQTGPTTAYPSALFHNVSLQTSASANAPRATLVKASAVAPRVVSGNATSGAAKGAHTSLQRRSRAYHPKTQRWIVLTSWTDSTPTSILRTITNDGPLFSPYAAVPTDGGWIFIQL